MRQTQPTIRTAFTLIELLVVIGIILVVVSLTIPAITAARRQAFRTRAAQDIQAICAGLEAYKGITGYYPIIYEEIGTGSPYNPMLEGNPFVGDGTGNFGGHGSDANNGNLYQALFTTFTGADGATYGPLVSPAGFTFSGTSPQSMGVYDRNGRVILYVPAHKGMDITAPPSTVWDAILQANVTSCCQFADMAGNPMFRIPHGEPGATEANGGSTWIANAQTGQTYGSTGASDMPLQDWRYILGNRWNYPSQDGSCRPDRGETPATTGPYLVWASGPSKDGLYGSSFGLQLNPSTGQPLGTTPSAANGWHGYVTDDIMNFTFQP